MPHPVRVRLVLSDPARRRPARRRGCAPQGVCRDAGDDADQGRRQARRRRRGRTSRGRRTSSTSRGTSAQARGSGPAPRCSGTTRYFYVAAEMEEPHVWGTLTQHDAVIFQDNDFEVFIDPDGDNHEYYEFEINALGHRVGPVPRQALSRRRPGRQRVGDPRAEDRRPRRRDAQRPARRGPRLVGRDRDPVGVAGRVRPSPDAPPRRRPVAGQLLAGRVAASKSWTASTKGPRPQGGQLGLVAPGRHRHAPPRALGLRPVLDRQAGVRGVPPRSRGSPLATS